MTAGIFKSDIFMSFFSESNYRQIIREVVEERKSIDGKINFQAVGESTRERCTQKKRKDILSKDVSAIRNKALDGAKYIRAKSEKLVMSLSVIITSIH